MSTPATDVLHDIHTATNDVLKGYGELSARAKPEIQMLMRRLTDMHQRHAAEQSGELARLREGGRDDSSIQGAVNKMVVMLRDWLANLDRDALPAVRDGEESLRNKYDEALRAIEVSDHPSVSALLKTQMSEINTEIARLPKE